MKTESKPCVKPPLTPQSSLDSKAPVTASDPRPRADPWVEDQLTTSEMENVTTVFRYFETGLREATILPKVTFLNHCLNHSFFSTLLVLKSSQFWNLNTMWQSMCLTINNPTNDDPPHLIEQEMGRGDGGGGVLDVIEWQLVAIIQNKNITYNLICSGSPGGNWCISVIVSVNQAGAGAD